jgi:hypothetical protein
MLRWDALKTNLFEAKEILLFDFEFFIGGSVCRPQYAIRDTNSNLSSVISLLSSGKLRAGFDAKSAALVVEQTKTDEARFRKACLRRTH